ncbi:MAG: acyl-CoA dehydrogenase family protein [Minicystis sp.]
MTHVTTNHQVLDAIRDLAPMISARAAEIEAARRVPADLLAQLRAAGCFRMFVPQSHGGEEIDLLAGLDVLETLARADGSTGWIVMIGSESPHLFSLLARDRFDSVYAGGPDVILGGAFNAQGEAHLGEGGYRVNGRWGFASGCQHVDWLFGNCVVLQDGRPRPGMEEGVPELRAMLFRPDQARIHDTWSVLGLRGTGSHDISVEDLSVPAADTVDIFSGQAAIASPNFVVPVLHCALHMAAVAVGIAQGALDDLVTLAKSGKRRLYARTSLTETPLFRHRLGRAESTLHAARAALHAFSTEFWSTCAGSPAAAIALAPRASATLTWVGEATVEVVDVCYRAAGGSAIRDGSAIQRRFRDIHTFSQHAATAEGWFAQAGAARLGLPTGFHT